MRSLGAREVKSLLETASGTIDAMQYAVERAASRLSPALMEGLRICANLAEKALNHSTEAAWNGVFISPSRLANVMNLQAEEALQTLDPGLKNGVRLDIAINENVDHAEYVFRYMKEGAPLTQDEQQAMDKAFKGWLGENNIVVEAGGALYQAESAKGALLKDTKGNNIPVEKEAFKNLVSDPEKGFEKYMQDQNYVIDVQQVPYPQDMTPSMGNR